MNIYSEINKTNDLSSAICLADINNEEQLKGLQSMGYLISFTKGTWEAKYPSIPAKYIYCIKSSLIPMDLMYIDYDHYIAFHTRVYGDTVMTLGDETFEESIGHHVAKSLEAFRNKDYNRLLFPIASEQSGNMVMQMLCKMLEHEPPSAKLYETFVSQYSFVDCGAKILTPACVEKALMGKSKTQRQKTKQAMRDLPETITVYRGEGSESTPYSKAYSWTTSLDKAYFFAAWRGGEKASIVTAEVNKSDVVEYITDRDEFEVLVLPQHIHNAVRQRTVSIEELQQLVSTRLGFVSAKHDMATVIETIKKLYRKSEGQHDDHDEKHTCRVVLLADYMFKAMSLGQHNSSFAMTRTRAALKEDYTNLIDAVIYHDAGRTDDTENAGHGAAGYQRYLSDNASNDVVDFLITYHCIDDEEAKRHLNTLQKTEKEKERIWELYCILKDADALDRWRFGIGTADSLEIDMLRLEISKFLIPVAAALQKYSF